MNKSDQIKLFDFFVKNKVENFLGVPDSTLKHFINRGLEKNKITITTKEEEAIGIATGMSLSKSTSLVFMQNAGFGNSISTITSLVQLYKIPTVLITKTFSCNILLHYWWWGMMMMGDQTRRRRRRRRKDFLLVPLHLLLSYTKYYINEV